MKIIEKEIEKLIPYALNSRTHSDEQIAQISASIKEFGFNNPILIDEKGGIIAGHGRVLGAKKLGLNKVPTIELAHLTPSQRKAYIIADNKLALNADWNMEMLSLEIENIQNEGIDLSLIGFDNFDPVDFQPEFNPSFTPHNVNDVNIEKASENMISQINGIQANKADQGTEVMCPHCGESFVFTGS